MNLYISYLVVEWMQFLWSMQNVKLTYLVVVHHVCALQSEKHNKTLLFSSSVVGPTLCDRMDCSMVSFPVLHHLSELAQTHVH